MKTVKIKGTIIDDSYKWLYDFLGLESTCPNDVRQIIDKSGNDPIQVEINSPGGSVFAGSEIYSYLSGVSNKNITTYKK